MRLFSKLYDRVMTWSSHPYAVWYLSGLSFAESSFFPIPPDVMLAPMSLGRPKRAYYFALITTLASVSGGMLGYLIGKLAFGAVEPWIVAWNYNDAFTRAQDWFEAYGFWAVFLAGFSPIPYKIFTITAGLVNMMFMPFVVASFVGRGARFFLVAGIVAWGGPRVEQRFRQHIDALGWAAVVLAIVIYMIIRFI
ncbi:MAG: YqaA family protein [Gammaproteobacteria bacterium]